MLKISEINEIIKSKGKIFRGPAFSSISKSAFGSIPTTHEKFLLHPSYLPERDRFEERYPNETPGVGKYNIKNDNSKNYSLSKKGLGNGFISKVNRFQLVKSDIQGKYINTNPNHYVIKPKKNFATEPRFKIEKISTPGPASYSPSKFDNWIWRNKNKPSNFNFISANHQRVLIDINNIGNPSPCEYFKSPPKIAKINTRYNEIEEEDKYNRKFNEEVKQIIKTENKKEDMKYRLVQNIKKENSYLYTNEDGISGRSKKTDPSESTPEKKGKSEGNIPLIRFKIEEEKEWIRLKQWIGNDHGKPDWFNLASPRWKTNKYSLRTPGPAFYISHKLPSGYSFNKNLRDFIVTKSPDKK